jgi:hypothetical protein
MREFSTGTLVPRKIDFRRLGGLVMTWGWGGFCFVAHSSLKLIGSSLVLGLSRDQFLSLRCSAGWWTSFKRSGIWVRFFFTGLLFSLHQLTTLVLGQSPTPGRGLRAYALPLCRRPFIQNTYFHSWNNEHDRQTLRHKAMCALLSIAAISMAPCVRMKAPTEIA